MKPALVLFFISFFYLQQFLTLTIKDSLSHEGIIGAYVTVNDRTYSTNNYGLVSIPLQSDSNIVSIFHLSYNRKQLFIADLKQSPSVFLSELSYVSTEVLVDANSEHYVRPINSISTIEMKQLKAFPTIGGEVDLLKVIQLKSGLSKGSEFSNGYYVRGGRDNQNLVLLDDVPIYNANHLMGFYSIFNPNSVQDVKLYKGNYPISYGGRLSSLSSIRLKEGNKKSFKGSAGFSLLSSQLNLEGPLFNKGSYALSYRRSYADLLLFALAPTDQASNHEIDNSSLYFYDMTAKLNYPISETDHIYLSGYFGKDDFSFADDKPSSGYYGKLNWTNEAYNLRYTKVWSDQLFSESALQYSKYNSLYLYNDVEPATTKKPFIESLSLKFKFDYTLNNNNLLTFGIQPTVYSIRTEQILDQETERASFKSNEVRAFINNQWKVNDRFTLDFGLHNSWFEYSDEYHIEPRFNLSYDANNYSLSFNIGRNVQYLHTLTHTDFADPAKTYIPASSYLPAEKSDFLSLGFSTQFKQYKLTTELYAKTFQNIPILKSSFSSFLTKEDILIGKGDSYGVEINLEKTRGKLNGWLNYTYSNTTYTFPEKNLGQPYEPKYHKPHTLNLMLNYDWTPKFKIGLFTTIASGGLVTTPTSYYYMNGNRIGNYTRENNFRLKTTYRTDINFRYLFNARGLNWELNSSLYNISGSPNPVYSEVSPYGNLQQFSIGFIPSFGIKVNF